MWFLVFNDLTLLFQFIIQCEVSINVICIVMKTIFLTKYAQF
jgi:hypothetical protein